MINSNLITDSVKLQYSKSAENKITDSFSKESSKKINFQTSLEDAIQKTVNKPVDKKLMDVCVEMESLFVAKMLKEMRKTVHKSEWIHGGQAEEIFEDMLYDEYAMNLSNNSDLGLAKMMYNEMSRK